MQRCQGGKVGCRLAAQHRCGFFRRHLTQGCGHKQLLLRQRSSRSCQRSLVGSAGLILRYTGCLGLRSLGRLLSPAHRLLLLLSLSCRCNAICLLRCGCRSWRCWLCFPCVHCWSDTLLRCILICSKVRTAKT